MPLDDLTRPLDLDEAPAAPRPRHSVEPLGVWPASACSPPRWRASSGSPTTAWAASPMRSPRIDAARAAPSASRRAAAAGSRPKTSRPPASPAATAAPSSRPKAASTSCAVGGGGAPGALIIQVPQDVGIQLAAAPDRRLVETRPLRLAAAHRRRWRKARSDVYARPVMTSANLRAGAPRIAIVVGGMGLNRAAHPDRHRPPAAARPRSPSRPMGRSRQAGRGRRAPAAMRSILQLPMESFGAESESPGPHMLHGRRAADETIDNAPLADEPLHRLRRA